MTTVPLSLLYHVGVKHSPTPQECALHTEQLKTRPNTPSVGFGITLNFLPAWCITLTSQQGKLSLREGDSWPEAGRLGLEPKHGYPGAFLCSLVLALSCVTLTRLLPLSASVSRGVCNEMTWAEAAGAVLAMQSVPCCQSSTGPPSAHCSSWPSTIHGERPHCSETPPYPPQDPLTPGGQNSLVTPKAPLHRPRWPGTAGP